MILTLNNQGIIVKPEDMQKHINVKSLKRILMDREKDIEEFNGNMIAYTIQEEINLRKNIKILEDKLTSFVPNSTVQYREYNIRELHRIIKDGHLLYGARANVMAGPSGQCHRNSAELWKINHKRHNVHIETGYALSKDGMWYQHSWLVYFNDKGKIEVIEATPLRRIAYYGFQLTNKEAARFYNLHH